MVVLYSSKNCSRKTYVYRHDYTSTVATEIRAQYTLTNNLKHTIILGSVPASADWSTAQFSFTTPANAKSVTIYQTLSKVGTLFLDNATLELEGTSVEDTVSPTISLTSPANGQSVSGTIAVTANASDNNVGVAGVQF